MAQKESCYPVVSCGRFLSSVDRRCNHPDDPRNLGWHPPSERRSPQARKRQEDLCRNRISDVVASNGAGFDKDDPRRTDWEYLVSRFPTCEDLLSPTSIQGYAKNFKNIKWNKQQIAERRNMNDNQKRDMELKKLPRNIRNCVCRIMSTLSAENAPEGGYEGMDHWVHPISKKTLYWKVVKSSRTASNAVKFDEEKFDKRNYVFLAMSVAFGLGLFDGDDEPTSGKEIHEIMQHAIAHTKSDHMCFLVWHHWKQTKVVREAMQEICGPKNVEPRYWVKANPACMPGLFVPNGVEVACFG